MFWARRMEDRLRHAVLLSDAAGLAGIGGGMLRDLLIQEILTVLRRPIYAVAGLAGAMIDVCQ